MDRPAATLLACSTLRTARRIAGAARLTGLGVLIVSTLVASSASADEIWWVARGADDLWNTDRNWVTRVSHEFTIPDGEMSVYLSGLPAALIDNTFTSADQTAAQTANFNVGGWGSSLDSFRGGDPTGHVGVLDVTGGELDVNGYIRLGVRGTGTINQSGGTVTTESQVTMGFLSTNSSGTYNLSGGIIDAPSLGIGVHGTGIFNMTGGLVDGTSRTTIGKGYSPAGVFPASGVMNQSGGIFQTQQLYLGDSAESVGALRVEGDALLRVNTRFATGLYGSGSITQDGGTIDLGWSLELGTQPGGFGEYTITQGTFRQTDAVMHGSVLSGVYVGTGGTGEFNVMGSGGEVDIAGVYEQNGLSTLTIELDGSQDRTPISVGRTATFAEGAMLRILLGDGYIPELEASFALLTAGQGVIDHGLEIVGSNSSDWLLDMSTTDVRVIYVRPTPEPSTVLLLASGLAAMAVGRRRGAL